MARLTMFSRFLITVAILAAVYFGLRAILPQFGLQMPGSTPQTTYTVPGKTENAQPASRADVPRTARRAEKFNYTPTPPVSGKLKGVVEVGAQGFNSFIIRVDNEKNWKLEKADYGTSLVYEKLASKSDIREGLKNYIADMLAFGVNAKDIHFVVSSGARKVDIMNTIIAELRTMGYVVNAVSAEQEARYGFRVAVPRAYEDKAFMVDIGSGNTKIAWKSGSVISSRETAGAKYFQIPRSDADVYREVSTKALDVAPSSRSLCFIIGGVPYELAKLDGKKEDRYTTLRAPENYQADGEKTRAGLNIYKAVADATGCSMFVFDWVANFTIGFLLELPY